MVRDEMDSVGSHKYFANRAIYLARLREERTRFDRSVRPFGWQDGLDACGLPAGAPAVGTAVLVAVGKQRFDEHAGLLAVE